MHRGEGVHRVGRGCIEGEGGCIEGEGEGVHREEDA